jgi:hypothetical protein
VRQPTSNAVDIERRNFHTETAPPAPTPLNLFPHFFNRTTRSIYFPVRQRGKPYARTT